MENVDGALVADLAPLESVMVADEPRNGALIASSDPEKGSRRTRGYPASKGNLEMFGSSLHFAVGRRLRDDRRT